MKSTINETMVTIMNTLNAVFLFIALLYRLITNCQVDYPRDTGDAYHLKQYVVMNPREGFYLGSLCIYAVPDVPGKE